ncbi:DUF4846 domain-containing protein [Kordia algicida OT-1]|uniref:DUF4846 domain-containing protein n=1 Tax=Kordia algicida OT-1 TaxID=391587 RepID=A9E4A1_9FLAO|nr:DUF4846 domain-containing protein [Kordia algicida]EDP95338.1 hypothetical protein KAOT1_09706 [Kordia algicida OT-1]
MRNSTIFSIKNTVFLVFLSLLFLACAEEKKRETTPTKEIALQQETETEQQLINPAGKTIQARFNTPKNYHRIPLEATHFGSYLRKLPLKKFNSAVKYFDGREKYNNNVYISVVDMEIGTRDLQQCADAVMRLRGEFLFEQNRLQDIHFNFLSDGKPRYFKKYAKGDHSYKKFRRYMNYIFAYANTASLRKELAKVPNIKDIQVGDVFIQQGNPFGHAVIVVDVAQNSQGEKIFMIAQSYMPAQETQILVNQNNQNISPWYVAEEGTLQTPEWTFKSSDLRRFKD